MTQDEFVATYGSRTVRFMDYYKYVFTFSGEGITVTFGGDSADIYRSHVTDAPITVASLAARENFRHASWPGGEADWDD